MENHLASPIFIHSLFRAGSTYLFHVFRRSNSGYWCYQEPLNERLLEKANKPGGFLVGVSGAHEILRHPEMEKSHTYEFHIVADEVKKYFRPEFSYEHYFSVHKDQLAATSTYFTALLDGAQGRAVFQCCRTSGRISGLKEIFSGVHIFLWRNPWDQWWSYKKDHYFDSRNLFILGARDLPSYLRVLKKELNIPEFVNVNPAVKVAYSRNKILDSKASYTVFYALWCHAMLEAMPHCEISICIDELTASDSYRDKILDGLKQLGVDGIGFSDCSVPMAGYGESDGDFFLDVENQVHQLLLSNGCTAGQLSDVMQLSLERKQSLLDTSLPENSAVRDAMHVREYMRTTESKLSEMQSLLFNERARAQAGR